MAELLDGSIITVKDFLTQQHTDGFTGKPFKDFKKELQLTNKDDVLEGRAGPIYKFSIKDEGSDAPKNKTREFIIDTNFAQVTVGVLEVIQKGKEQQEPATTKKEEESAKASVTHRESESKKTSTTAQTKKY